MRSRLRGTACGQGEPEARKRGDPIMAAAAMCGDPRRPAPPGSPVIELPGNQGSPVLSVVLPEYAGYVFSGNRIRSRRERADPSTPHHVRQKHVRYHRSARSRGAGSTRTSVPSIPSWPSCASGAPTASNCASPTPSPSSQARCGSPTCTLSCSRSDRPRDPRAHHQAPASPC